MQLPSMLRTILLCAMIPVFASACSDHDRPPSWDVMDSGDIETLEAWSDDEDSTSHLDLLTPGDSGDINDSSDEDGDIPDDDALLTTDACEDASCPQAGVCSGVEAVMVCVNGTPTCEFADAPAHETRETTCDGLDNDCDGLTDEGLIGPGCVPAGCTPDCVGLECGTDGCGGSCGTCAEHNVCNAAGTCDCDPGYAGDDCGVCSEGYTGYPDCHLDAVAASGGGSHTCALLNGGRVVCWGTGTLGELGIGSTFNRPAPAAIIDLGAPATAISARAGNSCALMEDATVRCWGYNVFGQVGNSTMDNTTTVSLPVAVDSLSGVVSVSVGFFHACAALDDGRVKCWGSNSSGQLGVDPGVAYGKHSTPVEVTGVSGVTAVASFASATCALQETGAVICWGDNASGELGDGTVLERSGAAVVPGLESGVRKIAAGYYHACALMDDGGVKCWGSNGWGQCGNGLATGDDDPAIAGDVVGLKDEVVDIAASGSHVCALLKDGRVQCWGSDPYGELGDGNSGASLHKAGAVLVNGLSGPAKGVGAGAFHSCAVLNDGNIQCWGADSEGQLGRGAPQNARTPARAVTVENPMSKLTMGYYHTCGINENDGVTCWGGNAHGQIGNGITWYEGPCYNVYYTPAPVANLASDVAALDAGYWHTCALMKDGSMKCWGYNSDGELGDGSLGIANSKNYPSDVNELGDVVTRMAASFRSTCAVLDSGLVKCWGLNSMGQIGPSTLTSLPLPRTVPDLERMQDVAGGYSYNCALGMSGEVLCWGSSVPGLTVDSDTPIEVQGLDGVPMEFAAGKIFACALMKHGHVRCWGDNTYGELGDGTTVSRDTAAEVVGLGGPAIAIAAGDFHACALLESGHVQCWGLNEYAQNGDGTLFMRSTPRWVTDLDGVATTIAAGPNQTCVTIEDGTLRCWGRNDTNQLGTGEYSWSPIPVTVRNGCD